jgi:hypothetical protein
MLFASVISDLAMWSLVLGYGANMALNRMFGDDWPRLLGNHLREWWARRTAKAEGGDS